ncbi:sensor histidine kinase [Cryobacterium psychrophilum]|uniref:sensor histidine kinase n=1 Tax=Cryobacterium psychrophilum TaxID=41988 RepID=UPI001416F798|nr:HAMP domain-containing sensor histidine kinase [Cryobacterium psychrophilum]
MTLTASSVVALMLLASGITLVVLLQQSLIASLDAAATDRAQTVASLVAGGDLGPTVTNTGSESSLVQVVDSSNSVVAATSSIDGQEPILAQPPSGGVTTVLSLDRMPAGDGPFRVVAAPVRLPTGSGWVYVATSTLQVDAAVGNLAALFGVGLPLVLLIVVWALWRAVGQVIRPVDAIRRRASSIGGEDLSQRVPVPERSDEIASLAVTMNEMLERLEGAALRQRQFVGDASHELRSPLAALQVQVEVALAHPEDPGSALILEDVHGQVVRMSALIADLLFLARSAEGAPRRATSLVDLDDLVLSEMQRLRELGGRAVELDGVRAARVEGSERDLARLLRNLGDNARDHARSLVSIRLTTTEKWAEFSVTDDGDGIRAEDRDRVFERFTRLDDARSRTVRGGGAGVGLSIVRQIVRDHHGTITIEDRPDGQAGAVFLVRLPLALNGGPFHS